jgi:hypothetical protein
MCAVVLPNRHSSGVKLNFCLYSKSEVLVVCVCVQIFKTASLPEVLFPVKEKKLKKA